MSPKEYVTTLACLVRVHNCFGLVSLLRSNIYSKIIYIPLTESICNSRTIYLPMTSRQLTNQESRLVWDKTEHWSSVFLFFLIKQISDCKIDFFSVNYKRKNYLFCCLIVMGNISIDYCVQSASRTQP